MSRRQGPRPARAGPRRIVSRRSAGCDTGSAGRMLAKRGSSRQPAQQPRGVVALRVAHAGNGEEVAAAYGGDVPDEPLVLEPGLHRDVRVQLSLEAAERVPHVRVPTLVGALVVLEASAQDGAGGSGLRGLGVGQPDVAVQRGEPTLRVVRVHGVELVRGVRVGRVERRATDLAPAEDALLLLDGDLVPLLQVHPDYA